MEQGGKERRRKPSQGAGFLPTVPQSCRKPCSARGGRPGASAPLLPSPVAPADPARCALSGRGDPKKQAENNPKRGFPPRPPGQRRRRQRCKPAQAPRGHEESSGCRREAPKARPGAAPGDERPLNPNALSSAPALHNQGTMLQHPKKATRGCSCEQILLTSPAPRSQESATWHKHAQHPVPWVRASTGSPAVLTHSQLKNPLPVPPNPHRGCTPLKGYLKSLIRG